MSRRIGRWSWARRATALTYFLLLVLLTGATDSWLRGGPNLTSWFGVLHFADPVAALEVAVASGSTASTLWIALGLVVVLTLLLGPVFCAWLCPLGLVLESVQAGFERLSRRSPRWRRRLGRRIHLASGLRLLVLGFVLAFAAVASLPLYATFNPIAGLVRGVAIGSLWVGIGAIVLIVVEVVLPRAWCRSLCPAGGLYGLLGRFAPWKVRIAPGSAGRHACHQCTLHCPMDVPVMEEFALTGAAAVEHIDCTRCGACVDHCPSGILRLGLRPPRRYDHGPITTTTR